MKRRRRLIRYVRSLAIAGAVFAVFASTAVAMPVDKPVQVKQLSGTVWAVRAGDTPSDRVPAAPKHSTIAYRAGDTAFSRVPTGTTVAYRAGDTALNRVPGSTIQPVNVPAASPTVIKDHGGQTLAIILAGSALAIALSGAALVVVRLNRNPVGLH